MKRTKKGTPQTAAWKFFLSVIAVAVAVSGIIFYIFARRPETQAVNRPIPQYFSTAAAAKPLPQTLAPAGFSNRDVVAAYQVAKEIPDVLAQQPCYCYCDRRGHRGLLDCFATKHGADCDICVKEALFAMQEHRKGKSPEQIRSEIIQGGWKAIQFHN
jgi:hypothetical protein